jgi:hypothetical protein
MLDQTMGLEVPERAHQQRLKICEGCPLLLRAEGQAMTTVRCGDCGCFVYVKSGLKDFTCPQGKW